MARERREPERVRNTSDPERPAYDNPVGNKGELAVGNNARKRPPPAPSSRPQGHASDKKLRGPQQ